MPNRDKRKTQRGGGKRRMRIGKNYNRKSRASLASRRDAMGQEPWVLSLP